MSGLFPTLWTGLRGWQRDTQRGAFQPFVLFMHGLGVLIFTTNGFVTEQIVSDFFWCIPAIIIGSWAGVLIYPFINEQVFRRIILGLILVSGITLLL
ncbi:MAG: hypothetical protein JKY49_05955 [Cohaesibacteraceae bacterium]|nr:hypothetical protein [Cohaesibacteraceae bacterium]